MKQLEALRLAKTKPWYTSDIYLDQWKESAGVRYCFLTPDSILGWGFSWEKAILDADKQWQKRGKL